MALKDILFTVQYFYGKTDKELGIEQFNRLVKIASDKLKSIIYGRIGEKEGFETEQQISDALLPFKTTSTIVLTTGSGTLPTDYWHKVGMRSLTGSSGFVSKMVDFVSHKECERRRDCSIDAPSFDQPIVELKSSTIKVYPITITSVEFTYLKTDTPIIGNYVTDYNVYTDVSPLLWKEDKHIDIIRLILGYLNIPLTNEQILAYTDAKVEKDN